MSAPGVALTPTTAGGQPGSGTQKPVLKVVEGGREEPCCNRNFFGARAPSFEGGLIVKSAGPRVTNEAGPFKLPSEGLRGQEPTEKSGAGAPPKAWQLVVSGGGSELDFVER